MRTIDLTRENFDAAIAERDVAVLHFSSERCAASRRFSATFAGAAARHTDALFARVDTDTEAALPAAFGVYSVPAVVILRERIPVFSHVGMLPPDELEAIIESVRSLDMADVRAEYAAYLERHADVAVPAEETLPAP